MFTNIQKYKKITTIVKTRGGKIVLDNFLLSLLQIVDWHKDPK